MSYINQSELEGEWLNQTIKIVVIREDGQSLERKYALKDGQTPEAVAVGIQEMVDELLDTSEI